MAKAAASASRPRAEPNQAIGCPDHRQHRDHLGMDGGQGRQANTGQDHGANGGPLLQVEQAYQRQHDERGGPDEMRDGQQRIPSGQLRQVQVQSLQPHPQHARVRKRLGQKPQPGGEHGEDDGQPAQLGDQQASGQPVDRQHQGHAADHARHVVGRHQRQVQEPRQVAEQQIEPEQEHPTVGFAGVGVGPEPGAIGSLAHLGQVGGRVIGDEEESGEVLPGRSPCIGQQIGEHRDGA